MAWRVFLSLLLCVMLTACGYTPVHGTRGDAQTGAHASLSNVTLTDIRESGSQDNKRTTQRIRNALLDRLGPARAPTYTLTTVYSKTVSDQTLQQDTSVTRKKLVLLAKISLNQASTGATLYQTTVQSTASFNTPRDPYALLIAERNAEERAARGLAENITTQISIVLSRQKAHK